MLIHLLYDDGGEFVWIKNNNITIFSQSISISYKYSCYQEKPCIELKKLKKIAIHKEEDTKSFKNVKN